MLLNDRESYKVSNTADPKTPPSKLSKTLSRLKEEKVVTSKDWYMAKPTEAAMVRFYGLKKEHASLTPVATRLPPRHANIRTGKLAIPEAEALAAETIRDLVRQNYEEREGQPTIQDLIELTEHCGTIKTQRRLFEEYEPTFRALYVNEIYAVIKENSISNCKKKLNSMFSDLHFTMDEEVEGRLPFLDDLVCRQPDGKMAASIYRKPTNTLKILSYISNHPL
ncbi:unnamed protein product [Dibothriocephalus latus]|uniref:Uncharacterized protein n=1 Tax=Dibothriocephalus latus TaxID=60516 RepID=A0A3P6TYT2_DIBLA|nr:unnamed protein product [Dibothriocephalus latus]